jgi:hypothetical protein
MLLFSLNCLGQVDSGLILLPNDVVVKSNQPVSRMVVYKSSFLDSFKSEYVRLIYHFDTIGRIITVEDYHKGQLELLIVRGYQQDQDYLAYEHIIPIGQGERIFNHYSISDRYQVMPQISLSYSLMYTYRMNSDGLFAEIIDYTFRKFINKEEGFKQELKKNAVSKYRFEYFN